MLYIKSTMCENVTLTNRESMIVFPLHATLFQQESADGLETQAKSNWNECERDGVEIKIRRSNRTHLVLVGPEVKQEINDQFHQALLHNCGVKEEN